MTKTQPKRRNRRRASPQPPAETRLVVIYDNDGFDLVRVPVRRRVEWGSADDGCISLEDMGVTPCVLAANEDVEVCKNVRWSRLRSKLMAAFGS
jgi:hypothetical protein